MRRCTRMRSLARLLLILTLVCALLPGCALVPNFLRKRRAKDETPKAPQLIGTVVLVNPEGGFVLVDSGSLPSPAMGKAAQARSPDGSVAELRVTEVRKRPFVIADVVNGTPRTGDQVFQ